ncbi:cI repressor protein [Pseudomonas sp. Leaf127]|uniref:LexA family transcriptional regulator n=1 Tax=Pseudomonas sp. Leaf127 TaxID=1736267 RepID=UPI0007031616|nr:LexA family transcriptional regulator [Pseudomonas sp. Leaf127]KQQ60124.1 cI repressor protein [Pseudomonas sp. Leaf127]
MKKESRKLPLTEEQIRECDLLKAIYVRKKPELGFTQEKIAADLGEGVSQGAVSHFMNRRTALNIKAASVFAKHLQVPIDEFSPRLANDLKNMTEALPPATSSTTDHDVTAIKTPLPIIGESGFDLDEQCALIPQFTAKAAAGLGYENAYVESRSTLAVKRDWLRSRGANPKNLISIYADGDSMWPTINDGDVLLVDRSRMEPVDKQVFVLAGAEGAIVKRLIQGPMGIWIIRSDNDENEDRLPLRNDTNEHRIIGQVIWRGGDL